jgi:hypothetical protein
MIGKVLGIIFLILMGLFTICSCKVADWADQEMEEELRRREQDEEKDI